MDHVHLHYVSPPPPGQTELPYVMGDEEAERWRRFDADRRNGVSIVGSLRDAWESGQ